MSTLFQSIFSCFPGYVSPLERRTDEDRYDLSYGLPFFNVGYILE